MSSQAVRWLASLEPEGMTNGMFRILFYLCDCHNDKRDPKAACFPSQKTLCQKTGLSQSGLNKLLRSLEDCNLIRRYGSVIPGTSVRRTHYMLNFDIGSSSQGDIRTADEMASVETEFEAGQTTLTDRATSPSGLSKLSQSGENPKRNPKVSDDDDTACPAESLRERILGTCGADPTSGIVGPNGSVLGTRGDMHEVERWRTDLSLSDADIIEVVRDVMTRKKNGPPNRFTYFTRAMQECSAEKSRLPLQPSVRAIGCTSTKLLSGDELAIAAFGERK
ncbi:helix-turn-helix domain-containing protein [Planktotalea arctica]|uniref:helix-turn-helix domain-containing protein n=1 Tax=Planktotalea arctica TaxID=1481893 RepID=UPI003219D25B